MTKTLGYKRPNLEFGYFKNTCVCRLYVQGLFYVCTYVYHRTALYPAKRNLCKRKFLMERDDEVAIVTTMLRKIQISVDALARTVSDIKDEVRTLKEQRELYKGFETAHQKEDDLVTKSSRVKLPKMLQREPKQAEAAQEEFIIGDIVRYSDDKNKVGTIERVSEKSVWVKLPRKKALQLKRKHKVIKVYNDV